MIGVKTTALTKRYGGDPAVAAVDLRVERGEVVGLVGPNGAGKSTLLALLCGRVHPTAGTASVLGLDPWDDRTALEDHVGHLPETPALDGARTGREHLDSAASANVAEVESLLDRVGVPPDTAARRTATYATGTERRVSLAMALAGDPDLLLLDEPTLGLDGSGVDRLHAIVRRAAADGTPVVATSRHEHRLREIADRIGRIDDRGVKGPDPVEDRRPDGIARVELSVDRAPSVDLETIPGVEDVVVGPDAVVVHVSDPAAKPTVVLEVAHEGVAVHDLHVSDPGTGAIDSPVGEASGGDGR